MINAWATTVLLFLLAVPAGQAADNMKAFPPAEKGMVRYVLQLPRQADESAFRVELIVGKTVEVDDRNRYFFGGKIEEEPIKGWGYTGYKVSKLGQMAGTLMAVDPNAPKVARFITLGSDPYIIRYNSRLPIVVYVPEGVEVRYRIWTAGAEAKAIEKGCDGAPDRAGVAEQEHSLDLRR
jgi:ecotin